MIWKIKLAELISVGLFLVVQSLIDWKERIILVWYCPVQWTLGVVLRFLILKEDYGVEVLKGMWLDLIVFALPGIVMFLASFFTEGIGGGDGLAVISLSPILGVWKQLGILFLAFFLVILVGFVQEGIKWIRRRKTVWVADYPFIPFLLIAYCFTLGWWF